MKSLVIFLNELSFSSSISAEEMLPHVLSALAAIRAARRLRRDIVLGGTVPFGSVLLGDGTCSLGAILRGDAYKDEWRFLRILDQSNPDDARDLNRLGELQEVRFRGQCAIGMLWAKQNGSAILSFAFAPDWSESQVEAQFLEMDHSTAIVSADVTIPNLSKPSHVTTHRELINNYGRKISSSSLIYEGEGFVIRIWFNDHNPPHFHVLARRDTSETLARCAIATLDFLSGDLSPSTRRRVREWAAAKIDHLMEAWTRCQLGQHPFSLEE